MKSRSLIFHLAILNLKMRFKSTYLGFLWAALEPLLYFIILYVVFTSIRETGENFAIYLITGVMLFHIFARGTSGGLVSLTINVGIIKSVKIRKEIFPVIATGSTCLFLFVQIGVLFGLMPVFDFVPSWTIVFLPIVFGLFLVLVLGASYLLSTLYVYVKDIQPIWNVLVYALFFVSPVLWRLDEVDGILLEIQKINPIGQIIELAHKVVAYGEVPPLNEWLYAAAFVFGILFFGYAVFHRCQSKIVEKI